METTNRLGLPLLIPGQSQKETVHNEALLALDTLVGALSRSRPGRARHPIRSLVRHIS